MTTASERSKSPELGTPVQFLQGVGPKRAAVLRKLELRVASDLLFFFPRDYQDMSELRPLDRLEAGQAVSVCGIVEEVELRSTGPGRSILGVLIRQGTHYLRAVWFNQPYLRDRVKVDQRLLLSGTPMSQGLRWEMTHPQITVLGPDEEPPAGQILPVYALTEGITQTALRRIVHAAVEIHASLVDEVFPAEYLQRHELSTIAEALHEIHLPATTAGLAAARRRFIFQELLVLQLGLALRREKLVSNSRANQLPPTAKVDARIRRLFPFDLTSDQNKAIAEITADMADARPMNRLLQGDVGSGKTAVAQYAMLLAVAHQTQAVLMAPTEVLARQHAETFARSLRLSRAKIGLLTGSLSAAERRSTLDQIARGEIDLVVGTQAVLNERVQFHRPGLVVIDEQHRFGVRQRALLREAGQHPHYLVMTATPIPRTMAMTLFGDLDVSTLRHAPPNRRPIHTYLGHEDQKDRWWEFFRKKLREGRQGYVITPLVEDSVQLSAAISAEAAFEALANGPLDSFRLDLVHGQLDTADKQTAMDLFRTGETQVLVSTSVVEVGVDVPNATMMTIENGDRFGLAQLHQLRGRVSRGRHPGYVCVFAPHASPEAQQRLKALARTSDGFELAEIDFQLRGPGNLFGLKQHGLPPLRIADLQRDATLVQEARRAAQQLVRQHPQLAAAPYARLRRMVVARYGKALDLSDVG